MANNPYVNKVKYGNQTVMDISDTTANEPDVAEGEVFYKGNGQRAVGTGNYYSPNDTAETDIADGDYFPFYDTSASAKKKSLWSNIVAKMKTAFGIASSGSTYLKKDGTWGTPTNTKNTAGSSDTSNKIYLIGATSQAANPQTYSDNEVFAQNGQLNSRKGVSKVFNELLTGAGTAGSQSGSTYYPARWIFDLGFAIADGDIVTIKIPVAGYSKGIWMSVDNGSNYYPVALNGTTRLDTQYGVDTYISLVFEANGSCSIYALNGSTGSSTVTGGVFRVINYYNTDTNTKVTQTNDDSTNADYRVLYSATADNTTRTEGAKKCGNLLFNPLIDKLTTVKIQATEQIQTPTLFVNGIEMTNQIWKYVGERYGAAGLSIPNDYINWKELYYVIQYCNYSGETFMYYPQVISGFVSRAMLSQITISTGNTVAFTHGATANVFGQVGISRPGDMVTLLALIINEVSYLSYAHLMVFVKM